VRMLQDRRLLSAVLVGSCLLLAGCGGGGDGIPSDASVTDFCKASGTFSTATEFGDGVKAARKLHDTGTPKGIPSDARAGFELVVRLVDDAKDQADLERQYNKLTSTERKSVNSLDVYISKTCPRSK
jgi:hypothetical protein